MKLTNQTFTEMADSINADLAAESKREAKGVSWDLHQRECDKNEALEYEIETLQAKVADLMDAMNLNGKALDDLQNELPKIKADTIREAASKVLRHNESGFCIHCSMIDYADKLERGEL